MPILPIFSDAASAEFHKIQSGPIIVRAVGIRKLNTLIRRVVYWNDISPQGSEKATVPPVSCSFPVINRRPTLLAHVSSSVATPCAGAHRCCAGSAARARAIPFAQVTRFSSWPLAVSAKPLAAAGTPFLREPDLIRPSTCLCSAAYPWMTGSSPVMTIRQQAAGQSIRCDSPAVRTAPSLRRANRRLPIAPMRTARLSCIDSPTRRCA